MFQVLNTKLKKTVSVDTKTYVRKVTTATVTFKLNVQAELNIVRNFGLFRLKIKHFEKQQPEKND